MYFVAMRTASIAASKASAGDEAAITGTGVSALRRVSRTQGPERRVSLRGEARELPAGEIELRADEIELAAGEGRRGVRLIGRRR